MLASGKTRVRIPLPTWLTQLEIRHGTWVKQPNNYRSNNPTQEWARSFAPSNNSFFNRLRTPVKIFVNIFRKQPYAAPNRLSYTISGVPRTIFEDHYEVAGTDYKSWTIEYSCRNLPYGSIRFAWILTRSPHPPSKVIKKAKAVMAALGIDPHLLQRHKNTCVKAY
ncbi:Calycin [Trinorchestia longiramus]|nr:Calycin [Trinorchestia longiramus]